MNRDAAETIALRALAFIATDEAALKAFLATSGLMPAALETLAEEPETLAGVLDFLLADEERLLRFCAEAGLEAGIPARARARLPGAAPVA